MGTRCLTVLRDKEREIAVLYRQSDGYMDGHGTELASFLKGKRLINGLGSGDTGENAFNGAGCMAARIVSHFKGDEIGEFYLYPAGTRDVGEEYLYTVTASDKSILLECRTSTGRLLWKGSPDDWPVALEEDESESDDSGA